jgi:hypothetical protein
MSPARSGTKGGAEERRGSAGRGAARVTGEGQDFVALDAALSALEAVLHISSDTVKRDWRSAKLWLSELSALQQVHQFVTRWARRAISPTGEKKPIGGISQRPCSHRRTGLRPALPHLSRLPRGGVAAPTSHDGLSVTFAPL